MPHSQLGSVLQYLRDITAPRPPRDGSDGQLLDRFRTQHDEAAFTALVQRYGPLVLGVCRRVLRHDQDAEDAFQATFLVLVRKAGSIGKRGSVGSWLCGVAYRVAVRARANQARRQARERQVADVPAAKENEDAVWRDLRPILDEEVNRLPEKYRAPFLHCYLDGKTFAETAEILGWPLGTVATRLARARERLQAQLTRRGLALSGGVLATVLAQQASAAPVPAAVVAATVKTASLLAAGQGLAVEGASAQLVDLARAVARELSLSKLRAVAVVVLAVGLVSAGGLLLAHRAQPKLPRADDAEPVAAIHNPLEVLPAGPAAPKNDGPPKAPAEPPVPVKTVIRCKERTTLPKDNGEVCALAFAPDGQMLASGHGEKSRALILWDSDIEQQTQKLQPHKGGILTVAFAPNRAELASAGSDNTAKLIDLGKGKELLTLKGHGGSIYAVAFAPDGTTLATGSADKTVRLWKRGSEKELAKLVGHTDEVLAVAFSPDGTTLVSGSRDQSVKLWSWTTQTEGVTLFGHAAAVTAVLVSPDGKTLATASKDRTVKLWDLGAEPRERRTLAGHTAGVLCVACTPDGQTLASACEDGTVMLWDVATGKEWMTLQGHTGPVNAVAFSPDDKTLATGSKDATVKLWDVERQAE